MISLACSRTPGHDRLRHVGRLGRVRGRDLTGPGARSPFVGATPTSLAVTGTAAEATGVSAAWLLLSRAPAAIGASTLRARTRAYPRRPGTLRPAADGTASARRIRPAPGPSDEAR